MKKIISSILKWFFPEREILKRVKLIKAGRWTMKRLIILVLGFSLIYNLFAVAYAQDKSSKHSEIKKDSAAATQKADEAIFGRRLPSKK